MKRSDTHRRAQRVLSMVGELHKLGYQKIRISPGMSPSGMHWRCAVTVKSNFEEDNGVMMLDYDRHTAHYSSADGNEYFGWSDQTKAKARQLAITFIERFPDIAEAGKGRDWEYAGWFVEVLGHAEAGNFPIAYADWPLDDGQIEFTGAYGSSGDKLKMPLPPR